MSKTIKYGIQSGDLKIGDKVMVELEINEILNNRLIATPVGSLTEVHFWQSPFYTKPVVIPPNCDMVSVPKIGSILKSKATGLERKVERHIVKFTDGSTEEREFCLNFTEPVLKRQITQQEAVDLLAKQGIDVEIV